MKKLMMFALFAFGTYLANAAAVGWTIAGAGEYSSGGYNVYVIGINEVTGVDQIVNLVKSEGLDSVSSYAFASGSVAANGSASKNGIASGKTITYSGSGTDTYSAFALIWDSDSSNVSWTSTATISMTNDTTSRTFLFGNQSANLSANKTPLSPIPEPSSALLIIVGMAGLALRRKQK